MHPKANMPTVELPVAEPAIDAALAAVAVALTQPEYVYLLRVVVVAPHKDPKAKIPTVELPAAEPVLDAALAAVPEALTSPE